MADWLQGCYTAASFEDALVKRTALQPGETIYVKSGHAVSAHSVSFYAPDSEQAGLLARAQEIENLEKQLRAQALICDEAFFTGTTAEVTPIRELDRIELGAGMRGPITEKIQTAFFDIVNGRNPKYAAWLTRV